MNQRQSRFSLLAPLSIDERIRLSRLACSFFSPLTYRSACSALGKTPQVGKISPFTGRDFLEYLKATNSLLDAERYQFPIKELLAQLVQAHVLAELGRGNDPFLGTSYYFLRELTELEKHGDLWLALALGPEFILGKYQGFTLQVSGVDENGDCHAGTALVIAPNWLLTCAHVLTDMTVNPTQMWGGKSFTIGRMLTHPKVDVGLIEISPTRDCLPGLAFRDPRLVETIFTLGYPRIPLSMAPSIVMHRGEVTNTFLSTFTGDNLFLFSAVARPGNSGGPIISATGHVVGIVTKEIAERSTSYTQPFFAGIPTTELAQAISQLVPALSLPIEDYQ